MKEQEYRIELLLKTYLISLSHMHLKNYEQALTGFRTLISSHINLGMAYYHFVNTALQMTTDYNINETELIKLVNKYFDIQDPKEQIIEILKVYLLIQTNPLDYDLSRKILKDLGNKYISIPLIEILEFELKAQEHYDLWKNPSNGNEEETSEIAAAIETYKKTYEMNIKDAMKKSYKFKHFMRYHDLIYQEFINNDTSKEFLTTLNK